MSIVHATGFEYVDGAGSGAYSFDWIFGGTFGTAYSRWSGSTRGVRFGNGEHGCGLTMRPAATYVQGFSFLAPEPTAGTDSRSLCSFLYHGDFQVDVVLHNVSSSLHKLTFFRGSALSGGPRDLIATSSDIDRTAWRTLAIRVKCHATQGTIEVAVKNKIINTFTGLNTVGNTTHGALIDQCRLGGGLAKGGLSPGNWYVDYDDWYVDDANFLGELRMQPKGVPTGTGTYSQWTRSTGSTNYETVDEVPENTSDYNSTATVGAIDSFTFPALGVTAPVLGVNVILVAARPNATESGAKRVAAFARLSGVDFAGAGAGVPYSDYWCSRYRYPLLTKPGGGLWTETDIDNAEFGYKLES